MYSRGCDIPQDELDGGSTGFPTPVYANVSNSSLQLIPNKTSNILTENHSNDVINVILCTKCKTNPSNVR